MISKTSLTALLDVKQAANLLAVSTRTIRRLIARGELQSRRVGRQLRLKEDDLRTYLLKCRA
jgi:excisionase family DNA binding protein